MIFILNVQNIYQKKKKALFAYAILNYLNAWTDSMAGIIIMRTLIAIPVAALFVVSTGILTDIFREKERVFWLVR